MYTIWIHVQVTATYDPSQLAYVITFVWTTGVRTIS